MNIFSFNRFTRTLMKDVSDNRRRLLTICIGVTAFMLVADTVIVLTNAGLQMSALTELLGNFNIFIFFLASTLAPSLAFKSLGRKSTAIPMLMLPASAMEKFLTRWILVVPLTVLVLFIVACIGDVMSSLFSQLIFNKRSGDTFGWINYCRYSLDTGLLLPCLLFLQSFFFLGSLLWPRFSWGKTMICLAVMLILCFLLVVAIVSTNHIDGIVKATIMGREGTIWTALALTVVNYIISFYRFVEAEIINRW